ncbi:MAG: FadR family transcriptional regulator [Variibacter sp.]|nr:FadR family transcriptional regulator [Variibacter sp.]
MRRETDSDMLGHVAPLRQVKLSEQIYARIFGLIAGGEFPEQFKLPTENELALRFDVSRTIVREALARLRDDGIVISRQGTGTFVKRRPDSAVLKFAPVASIADIQRCFEFRSGFEADMASFAAARADDASIRRIRDALAALDAIVREGSVGTDADFDFHFAIAEATGNRFFVAVMASLRPHIAFGMNLARSLSLIYPAARAKAVQAEHTAIFDAISRRAPDLAREATRRHVENARHRMFEGQNRTDATVNDWQAPTNLSDH